MNKNISINLSGLDDHALQGLARHDDMFGDEARRELGKRRADRMVDHSANAVVHALKAVAEARRTGSSTVTIDVNDLDAVSGMAKGVMRMLGARFEDDETQGQ